MKPRTTKSRCKGLACAWERLTRASRSARKCYDRYDLSGTEAVSSRARGSSRSEYTVQNGFVEYDPVNNPEQALFSFKIQRHP